MRVLYWLVYALIDDDGVDRAFLGSVEKTAIYKRTSSDITFRLDAAEGASEEEIKRVFRPNLGLGFATEFLRNDLQYLLRIAVGPGSVEREWLKENLESFPPSTERQELTRALGAGTVR